MLTDSGQDSFDFDDGVVDEVVDFEGLASANSQRLGYVGHGRHSFTGPSITYGQGDVALARLA